MENTELIRKLFRLLGGDLPEKEANKLKAYISDNRTDELTKIYAKCLLINDRIENMVNTGLGPDDLLIIKETYYRYCTDAAGWDEIERKAWEELENHKLYNYISERLDEKTELEIQQMVDEHSESATKRFLSEVAQKKKQSGTIGLSVLHRLIRKHSLDVDEALELLGFKEMLQRAHNYHMLCTAYSILDNPDKYDLDSVDYSQVIDITDLYCDNILFSRKNRVIHYTLILSSC